MFSLLACATCVNTSQADSSNAAGWSIFFLLGAILLVLGPVVFFLVRMARRSEQTLDPEFRDDTPAASVTATR
ncbi:hypothetical protein [Luteolibacter sp. Populi]|uniref:hypothetical protein n=1 Tax=Luteolibacter sp. Populi TaxID=3230487 RepID=UPI003466677B